MRKRSSRFLAELKAELRRRALKEQNEEKRSDYWRMYFKALNAEGEIREMVMEAEIRRLVEFLRADGSPDAGSDEAEARPPDDNLLDDDDIPPRQKGLWDE